MKPKAGKVSAVLEKALAEEVEEISRKHQDGDNKGKYVYDVMDRTRVYNQALKLEAIKAKLPDGDFGKEFK